MAIQFEQRRPFVPGLFGTRGKNNVEMPLDRVKTCKARDGKWKIAINVNLQKDWGWNPMLENCLYSFTVYMLMNDDTSRAMSSCLAIYQSQQMYFQHFNMFYYVTVLQFPRCPIHHSNLSSTSRNRLYDRHLQHSMFCKVWIQLDAVVDTATP